MTTLAHVVTLIAADLQDPDHVIWSAEDHANHIRRALAQYSALNPQHAVADLEASPGVRAYDISSLGAMEVTEVWYPWAPEAPSQPCRPVTFWLLDRHTLYLAGELSCSPATGRLGVFFLAPHTLAGLDGATQTTLDAVGLELVILLATASAAMQRCQASIGKVTVSGWTPQQLLAWASARQTMAERAWETLRRRLSASGDARVSWEERV